MSDQPQANEAFIERQATSLGVETPRVEAAPQPQGAVSSEIGQDDKLVSALNKERDARKQLENQLKAQAQKERELEQKLERVKDIDPTQYSRLIQEQAERDEQNLLRRQEFEKAREGYRVQTEAATKRAEEAHHQLEALTIRTATEKAFFESGGRKSTFDLSAQGGEDIAPVEAMLALFRGRVRLEEGKVVILNSVGGVELNSEGRPKSLTEKMSEIKKGSMGSLFAPENNNSGSGMNPTTTNYQGKQVKLFSREQARSGKASMSDIASGKAFVN